MEVLKFALWIKRHKILFDPVFASYYHKKRLEGKAHRVALSHTAKKLVRVIYTLETQDIDYDASKLR